MKLTEILTESEQTQLDELNIGKGLNAIGRGIGRVAGGAAQSVGAVAGGVAGMGSAFKKGFKSGKDLVGQGTDDGGDSAQAQPAGTPPAKPQTGKAAQALAKTVQAAASQNSTQAGQTVYAQVKALLPQLDKKGMQRISTLLQKSMASAPTRTKPAPVTSATSQTTQATTAAKPAQATQKPSPAATASKPAAPAQPKAALLQPKPGASKPATKKLNPNKRLPAGTTTKTLAAQQGGAVQTAGKEINRPMIGEGFSLFRNKSVH